MKKYHLPVFVLLFLASQLNGQYSTLKEKYDYKDYTYKYHDPYDPIFIGVTTFLIPGLGHYIAGEYDRGSIWFGSFIGCAALTYFGYSGNHLFFSKNDMLSEIAFTVGLLGIGFIKLESIFDAVRVAKVKNLAYDDKGSAGLKMEIAPYFLPSNRWLNSPKTFGLSIALDF